MAALYYCSAKMEDTNSTAALGMAQSSNKIAQASSDQTPGSDELRWKLYSEQKDHLWRCRQSNIEHADKTVLTLSSALLALSVAFLKDVIGERVMQVRWALVSTWAGFGAAVLLTLASFYLARRANERQEKDAYDYYIERKKSASKRPNKWECATEWLNVLAAVFFFLGFIFGAVFVSYNLPEASDARRTSNSTADPTKSAAAAPTEPTSSGTASKAGSAGDRKGTDGTADSGDPGLRHFFF